MTITKSINPPSQSPQVGDIWVQPYINYLTGAGSASTSTYVSSSVKVYTQSSWIQIWSDQQSYDYGAVLTVLMLGVPYMLFLDSPGSIPPNKSDVKVDKRGEVYLYDGTSWIPVSPQVQTSYSTQVQPTVNTAVPAPTLLSITSPTQGLLVEINADGTITYGPNYIPDAAAAAFWGAIYTMHPDTLMQKIKLLEAQLANMMQPGGMTPLAGPSGKNGPMDPKNDYDRAMKMFP